MNWKHSYLIFGHDEVGDSFCLDTEAEGLPVRLYSHETIEVIEEWSTLQDWAEKYKSVVERYHN